MILIGVFTAAITLAIVSAQIDGNGAANTPSIPKTAIVEPETKFSEIDTSPVIKSGAEKVPYSDPGVKKTLSGTKKDTSVEKADMVNIIATDPNRRSAMQFGKDDETSTDWIK